MGQEIWRGRGGWTWYTGSASWFAVTGIEYILGLKIENNILKMSPCIPSDWKEYSVRYKYNTSIYNIKVFNQNGKVVGVEKLAVDGIIVPNKEVRLKDDGGIYSIEVYM